LLETGTFSDEPRRNVRALGLWVKTIERPKRSILLQSAYLILLNFSEKASTVHVQSGEILIHHHVMQQFRHFHILLGCFKIICMISSRSLTMPDSSPPSVVARHQHFRWRVFYKYADIQIALVHRNVRIEQFIVMIVFHIPWP
jgi:hypothetical protein